jgi:hypothetical protein
MAVDHPDVPPGTEGTASARPSGGGVRVSEGLRDLLTPANLRRSARRHKFAFLTLIVGLGLAFYLVWRIAEHELTMPARIGLDDGPVLGILPRDVVGACHSYPSRIAGLSGFAHADPH